MQMFARFAPRAALVVLAFAARAQAVIVDYNTPGQLTSEFSLNTAVGIPIKYSQVATGGLGNSGAASNLGAQDADHTTAVYTGRSWGLSSPGQSITVSHFVKRRDALITQTPFQMLGVVSDTSERMDGGDSANSYASIRLMPGTSPSDPTALATRVFLQTETKVNGGARVRTTPGLSADLIAGDWYRLSATFAYNSASDVLMSMALENWGPTGTLFQSTVLSMPATLIALSGADQVNSDAMVWPAFRTFLEGGTTLQDDFTVVPEPATFALLLVGVAAARRARPARMRVS